MPNLRAIYEATCEWPSVASLLSKHDVVMMVRHLTGPNERVGHR